MNNILCKLNYYCLFIFLLVFISACAPATISNQEPTNIPPTQAPTPTALTPTTTPPTNLEMASRFAPTNSELFAFTDWSLIKKYKNQENLTGNSNIDDKITFLLSTNKDQAAAACFACQYFKVFWNTWEWDELDLDWEVHSDLVSILKFRDNFDFNIITQKFVERGFTKNEYLGIPVYTHKMDPNQEWIRYGLSIINTAVLIDHHVLIMSTNPDQLNAFLDVAGGKAPAFGDNPAIKSLISTSGELASTIIFPSNNICTDQSLSETATLPQQLQTLQANIKESTQTGFNEYKALALGYRYIDNKLEGIISFSYEDNQTAQADLNPRKIAATEGYSLAMKTPYTNFFTLIEAKVIDNVLLLKLKINGNLPARLFRMAISRDLWFASCPK